MVYLLAVYLSFDYIEGERSLFVEEEFTVASLEGPVGADVIGTAYLSSGETCEFFAAIMKLIQ
jgi:hypothetical protein